MLVNFGFEAVPRNQPSTALSLISLKPIVGELWIRNGSAKSAMDGIMVDFAEPLVREFWFLDVSTKFQPLIFISIVEMSFKSKC